MSNIQLNEFLGGVNIMGVISNNYPLSNLGNVDLMNDLLLLNHGQKLVRTPVLTLSIEKISKMIVLTYSKKWDDIKKSLELEIDILKSNFNTTVENASGTNSFTDKTASLDKVSGFNSAELIVNNGSDNDLVHTGVDSNERTINNSSGSLDNAIKNLLIMGELNIINIVLSDVSNLITLEIY